MTTPAEVDLELLLDGALDDFDRPEEAPAHLDQLAGGNDEERSQKPCTTADTPDPDGPAPVSESKNDPTVPLGSRAGGGAAPKFNPLGKKPKKPKPAALPPPAINDLSDISQEELQSSAKELATMLQSMMKENQPDEMPPPHAASMQATLDQINQAARRAAEGSTGAAAGAEEAPADEMQKMMEAMQKAMGGDSSNMDSFVETLMHGILSKDVLYEPLKDISNRFPKWLEENEARIPAEEARQHRQQMAHINTICKLLEDHGDSKFDELLKLLQELQAMGQPPQELLQQMQAASAASGAPDMDALGAAGQQCPLQ